MRQLPFAATVLAIASLTATAAATEAPVEPCTKPVVSGSIPADGMTDVPIDTIARVWLTSAEADCTERRYWLELGGASSVTLQHVTYTEFAPEGGVLPANSQAKITLEEDGHTVWSATFTTGSALAAPQGAPSDAELVSFVFVPVSDGLSYVGIARVRVRPSSADPLTSAVLTFVGGDQLSNHVQSPDEDGWFDVSVSMPVQAGETHCVRPGLQNAAGKIAYGEPFCADAPPKLDLGCSIGSGVGGKGSAALMGLLVGVAGAVVRRVKRRRAA